MAKQRLTATQLFTRLQEPLVAAYKRRSSDVTYYSRTRLALKAMMDASAATEKAAVLLSECKLDREHTSQIDDVLRATSQFNLSLKEFGEKLTGDYIALADAAWAVGLCTSVDIAPKKGRPALKYLSETREVVLLYEMVTRKRVPFPKANKGQLTQRSTSLIAQCLKDIDPKITESQVITLIRRVLSDRDAVDIEKLKNKN